jgi:hypothetical protein
LLKASGHAVNYNIVRQNGKINRQDGCLVYSDLGANGHKPIEHQRRHTLKRPAPLSDKPIKRAEIESAPLARFIATPHPASADGGTHHS